MDSVLSVIFGLVSIASFGFALWQYHNMKIKEEIERGKVNLSTQRLKQAYNSAHSIAYSADMIVQRSKAEENVSINELRNLARTIRAQAIVLIVELKSEHSKMKEWRYGVMVNSDDIEEKIENKIVEDNFPLKEKGQKPNQDKDE